MTVNGGKSYVSVINTDGTGLTNLVEIPTAPAGEMVPLDWPAGDWIYYERTHDPADVQGNDPTSVDIWRVNANTSVAEKVCNVTDGSITEIKCTYLRRFSLTLKADKMAVQTMGKYNCTADGGVNIGGNCVWPFPPSGCKFTGSITCRGMGSNSIACNWVDQVAFNISKNPKVGSSDGNDGVMRLNNCTGDMWISAPANNPNGDKYEGLNGVWQTVGVSGIGMERSLRNADELLSAIIDTKGNLRIDCFSRGNAQVRITDLRGKMARAFAGSRSIVIPAGTLKPGVYAISELADGQRYSQRVTISR